MSNLLDWLHGLSDRPTRRRKATPKLKQGATRADEIASLRSEITRLQQELVVLSQAEDRTDSPKEHGQAKKSIAMTERLLLDAQRTLATLQARI